MTATLRRCSPTVGQHQPGLRAELLDEAARRRDERVAGLGGVDVELARVARREWSALTEKLAAGRAYRVAAA